jgi:hypothetical protein
MEDLNMSYQMPLPAERGSLSPSRTDDTTATIINAALRTLAEHGRQAAAAYMEERNISFATIVRVLNEPDRRRAMRPARAFLQE